MRAATPRRTRCPLADDTYAERLTRLEASQFTSVPGDRRQHIRAFYRSRAPWPARSRGERKRHETIARRLAGLEAATTAIRR